MSKFYFLKADESLSDDFLPKKANDKDTGYDVKAAVLNTDGEPYLLEIKPGEKVLIPTGLKAFIPDGWWLQINPRSSTFTKLGLTALVGVIDEGYENEIKLAVRNDNDHSVTINFGDRVGQLIPIRREVMDAEFVSSERFAELCAGRKNTRGTGGFGSSGK